ncbi:MAG: copper chaperone PCu(A)C [Pseudomonadota bacterium]
MKTLLFSAVFTAATAVYALAEGVMAKDPFAFATAASAKAGGAYITLMNHGEADRLIGAKADVAKRVEVHEHIKDGDVMRMREVEAGIELPAGGMIEMKPGGYHVMLMGLNAPLEAGQTFPVTLVFESGEEMTVDVAVKTRDGHSGHSHSGHSHSGHSSSD